MAINDALKLISPWPRWIGRKEVVINPSSAKLRRALGLVAIANLSYFGIEFFFALRGDSVSLFADSIDFLEDAFVNFLILVGLGWSLKSRAQLGRVLACLLMVPGLSTLWSAFTKFSTHAIPDPEILSAVGGGAFVVNAICALLLVSFRHGAGSLTRAAFLSARNDLLANLAIIMAGFVTAYISSFWPDLIVGLGIALMNADAAREVWSAAQKESLEARS